MAARDSTTHKNRSPNLPSVEFSPGNNPFDDMLKKTLDAVAMSDQLDRRSSLRSSNFLGIGRKSLSFRDLNLSDFGRESIGILPPDFGRDSMDFMNMSSFENGRESLGILHINTLRDSVSFGRESLDVFNLMDFGRESLNCGRESLGIINLKSVDTQFGDEDKKIPDILLTTIEESSDYICNPLDVAFLHTYSTYSRKSSAASSTPSFNSQSLEGPSSIYSLSYLKHLDNSKADIWNRKCYNINEFNNSSDNSVVSSIHSPLNKAKFLNSSDLLNSRSRIQSLPTTLEEKFVSTGEASVTVAADRRFWSSDRTIKTRTLVRRSFHGTLDFTEDDFHDSVFIEGHHIAEKFADGSILNDSSGSGIGILDSTPQPIWPDDPSYTEKEEEDVKCDKETVFKKVDKMLPPPVQDTTNLKLKTSKGDNDSSNENNADKTGVSNNSKSSQTSEKCDSKLIQNVSDIPHNSSKRSYSKSKDAREILQNLSEILNCSHPSDKQKSEGQNLLCSLADILSENGRPTSPDDSGHSSSINEPFDSSKNENNECFEVLDLRTKSGSGEVSKDDVTNRNGILDLSSKSKSVENVSEVHVSQSPSSSKNVKNVSFNTPKKRNTSLSSLDINKNKTASVHSSVNSNDSRNSNNASKLSVAGKLKVKTASSGIKKGPLKAVIPVADMKKRHSLQVTPDRADQKQSGIRSKRTSTPIYEPKLKPMAASTPSSLQEKDHRDTATSPLSSLKRTDTNSKLGRDKTRSSTSSLPRMFIRRNSLSEAKKTESVGRIKRSNSIENESGVMSSLAKVRHNIVNSPYYQLKKQNPLSERNSSNDALKTTRLEQGKLSPIVRQGNSISKQKKLGKENVRK